jgi:hypothetical protein
LAIPGTFSLPSSFPGQLSRGPLIERERDAAAYGRSSTGRTPAWDEAVVVI